MEPKVAVTVMNESTFTVVIASSKWKFLWPIHEVVSSFQTIAQARIRRPRNHPAGPRVVVVVEVEIISAAEGPVTVVLSLMRSEHRQAPPPLT